MNKWAFNSISDGKKSIQHDGTDGIIDSTSTSLKLAMGKIGFYNVAPIARALLATGVSHTVDDIITALQNLGLVRQS